MYTFLQRRYLVLIASLFFSALPLFLTDFIINTSSSSSSLLSSSSKTISNTETLQEEQMKETFPVQTNIHGQEQQQQRQKQQPSEQFSFYRRATNLTRTATIVIQLSGEMANNLQHIAHGVGLQLWALDEFDINCNVILRHQEGPNSRSPRPKWKSARDAIQMCFPKLANWDFSRGNDKREFENRQRLQHMWLQGKSDYLFGLVNSANMSDIRQGLQLLSSEILNDPNRPWIENDDDANTFHLPYLFSESLDAFPMIDRYYTQIRDLMEFNDSSPECCAQLPQPKDSVFHFRNFQSEMPDWRARDMGFLELSPHKVAQEVFSNMEPSNSGTSNHVKITTRFFNQIARNYAEVLQNERGINSSLITDQSALQDFCFLKHAQNELVGSARSTFVLWAALLGNSQRSRLYHVENYGLLNRHPNYWERFTYNWTNPELQQRIHFEWYQAEEMEKQQHQQ